MTNFETEMNEKITTIIEEMNIDEQFWLFRQYCEDAEYYDDMPERVEDIDELYYGMKPSEILDELEGLNTNWKYFCYNGWENVEQWEGIDCVSDVVDYIIENENELGNDDIQEVLDTYANDVETLYLEVSDEQENELLEHLENNGYTFDYNKYDYMIIL